LVNRQGPGLDHHVQKLPITAAQSQRNLKPMFDRPKTQAAEDTVAARGTEQSGGDRRRSVLHDGITIQGEWTSDGIVDFGGTFTGDLKVDTLFIAKSGRITGNVTARIVTIEGTLDGTISADSVVIKTASSVKADITTKDLVVETGSTIAGDIRCTGATTE
jgi:cytoskeletal protein CcmA (bactofilin family)